MPESDDVQISDKSTLRVSDTLVSLMSLSDRTHLVNCAGKQKEWPEYMAIGNLSLKICQMPSMHSVVMVALLPIAIKNWIIAQNISKN